jgi:ribosomal protein S18 acetylase RimI-like enzyme
MEIGAGQEVVLIPHEYSKVSTLNQIAEAFRRLRLQALQTDPGSFSSSYTTESQQPLSFWTKRLLNPQSKTYAVIPTDSAAPHDVNSKHVSMRPWLGMLVLLGPKAVDPDAYDNSSSWKTIMTENSHKHDEPQPTKTKTQSSSVSSALAYHIVAVYVAPEVRGNGLAKKLMSAALASAEQDSKEMGSSKAICTLNVERNLVAARRTYEIIGFVPVAEDHITSEDRREFYDSVMRRDLTF